MKKLSRRKFIGTSLSASIGASLLFPRSSRAADASIDILLNEPIGTINPNIYGHFVEHLGAVVYDGIWVGEKSKIPNYNGIRKDLVDALKRISAPVIRYPGGCFADSYDWRDGIGDREKRPRRTNFWQDVNTKEVSANSTSRFEPNHFGTNEFLEFCKLTGAKPYMAANLRSLPPQVFNEWVEYCNSPTNSTTLAVQRANGSAGSKEPFNVEFWGIGNESWGCGGNFTPEEYSADKVVMANIAQLVNCLQSLFLADGDKFLLTPTYHVFEMFKPHLGAEAIRTIFASPNISYERNGKAASFWGLQGSASRKGKTVTLTVTNPHPGETRETEISLRGAKIQSIQPNILSAKDTYAHNTFENPANVKPRTEAVNNFSNFRFAPASVTQLQIIVV